MKLPVLFISHESPYLWDTPSKARAFLLSLSQKLPEPKAIVVISAHWMTDQPSVSGASQPSMIYDFSGFPAHYHDVQYPASGDSKIADRIVELCQAHSFPIMVDSERGFDHAVWIPVGLMFPKAEIPIVSFAVQPRSSTEDHFQLGRSLSALRDEGVLIIGSGTATHNLRAFFSGEMPQIDGQPDSNAVEFSEWLIKSVESSNIADLLKYRRKGPKATFCHPTKEHFLPLIVALGAGYPDRGQCIHYSFNYEHFAMTCFQWGLSSS